MATTSDILARAVESFQADRLAEAEHLCRQVLLAEPRQVSALHLMGVIAGQRGQGKSGIDFIREAVSIKPDYADAHNSLGNLLREAGELHEALASYREALRHRPAYAEAHCNLGAVLRQLGQLEEATASYRQALHCQPDHAAAHNNLGNVLQAQGRVDEAADCYRQAIRLRPDYAEAYLNLGEALFSQGRLEEALECYRQVLGLNPTRIELRAQAHHHLGLVLRAQGRIQEAEARFREAAHLNPDYSEAHHDLGIALYEQGQLKEAEDAFRKALGLWPEHADAINNLGLALAGQGRMAEAVASFQQALACNRNNAEAHNNIGFALSEQGRYDEAVASFREALRIKPDRMTALDGLIFHLQLMCQWGDLDGLWRRMIEVIEGGVGRSSSPELLEGDGQDRNPNLRAPVAPFSMVTLSMHVTTAAQQHRCARRWVEHELRWTVEEGRGARGEGRKNAGASRPSPLAPRLSKIKLGYLSADFRNHVAGRYLAELIENHDRGLFDVFGYSYGPDDGSPLRQRLARLFDRFVDVQNLSHQDAARRMREDGVDIAIDLMGYTRLARPQIPALRPAPIQVNYGFPGTMGAPFMDYILVDDFVVPAEQQPNFTEKLVHVPGCILGNDNQRQKTSKLPTRSECGLPPPFPSPGAGEGGVGGFVFCGFNNSYKITPMMFNVWMRLLQKVPGSVLWLQEGNRFVPGNLRREAEARGVAGSRLVFAERLPELTDHLARFQRADLFLDTMPYNAQTTASDALWSGCPVLTLAGETYVSRMAGSLLRAMDLPELITTSLEEYEAMGLRLARDPDLLGRLRKRIQDNRERSGLFDGKRIAKKIEAAYTTMWEKYKAGEEPAAFVVTE